MRHFCFYIPYKKVLRDSKFIKCLQTMTFITVDWMETIISLQLKCRDHFTHWNYNQPTPLLISRTSQVKLPGLAFRKNFWRGHFLKDFCKCKPPRALVPNRINSFHSLSKLNLSSEYASQSRQLQCTTNPANTVWWDRSFAL